MFVELGRRVEGECGVCCGVEVVGGVLVVIHPRNTPRSEPFDLKI